MIVRYIVEDPFHIGSTEGDYLLVFQVPEGSPNERAFVWMLETSGLDYVKIEAPKRKKKAEDLSDPVVINPQG